MMVYIVIWANQKDPSRRIYLGEWKWVDYKKTIFSSKSCVVDGEVETLVALDRPRTQSIVG